MEGNVRPLGNPTRGMRDAGGSFSVYFEKRQQLVHRLVALAFLGPPPSPLHTVDHIDRKPENNNINNLRWATPSEQRLNQGSPVPRRNIFTTECQGDLVVEGEAERWLPVPGTSGMRISTMGRIQRKRGSNWQKRWTPLPAKRHGGYCCVKMPGSNSTLSEPVHRIVLRTFVGFSDDPSKTTVDHVNNVRNDNRLSNLRWATKSEQALNTVRGKRKRRTFPEL